MPFQPGPPAFAFSGPERFELSGYVGSLGKRGTGMRITDRIGIALAAVVGDRPRRRHRAGASAVRADADRARRTRSSRARPASPGTRAASASTARSSTRTRPSMPRDRRRDRRRELLRSAERELPDRQRLELHLQLRAEPRLLGARRVHRRHRDADSAAASTTSCSTSRRPAAPTSSGRTPPTATA